MDLLQAWDELQREQNAAAAVSHLLIQHVHTLAKQADSYPAEVRKEMLNMLTGKADVCSIDTLSEEVMLMDEQLQLEEQRLVALQNEERRCDGALAKLRGELQTKQQEHAAMKDVSMQLFTQLNRLKEYVSDQMQDTQPAPGRRSRLRERIRRSISIMPVPDREFWTNAAPMADRLSGERRSASPSKSVRFQGLAATNDDDDDDADFNPAPGYDMADPSTSPESASIYSPSRARARSRSRSRSPTTTTTTTITTTSQSFAPAAAGMTNSTHGPRPTIAVVVSGSQISIGSTLSNPPAYTPASSDAPPQVSVSFTTPAATRPKRSRSPPPNLVEGDGPASNAAEAERSGFATPMRELPRCGVCTKNVTPYERLNVDRKPYHKRCFRCCQCFAVLTATTATLSGGSLYCPTHCPTTIVVTHGGAAESAAALLHAGSPSAAIALSPVHVSVSPGVVVTVDMTPKSKVNEEKKQEKKEKKEKEKQDKEDKKMKKKMGEHTCCLASEGVGGAVPVLVTACIAELDRRALNEVEIYRRSGVKSKVEALKNQFCSSRVRPDLSLLLDLHEIAGCLKLYLRSLEDPVVPAEFSSDLLNATGESDAATRFLCVQRVLKQLPPVHRSTLALVGRHLQRVGRRSEINRMSFESLAIIFAPVLLRSSLAQLQDPRALGHQTAAVRFLIENSEILFPL